MHSSTSHLMTASDADNYITRVRMDSWQMEKTLFIVQAFISNIKVMMLPSFIVDRS
jgi:hypothetical protein